MVEYLEAYAEHHGLEPRLGVEVRRAGHEDGGWRVETPDGPVRGSHLVVATGYTDTPVVPSWPGLDGFPGPVLHSSGYRNGRRFRGQRVLVVGIGNSGGEIAIDLVEHGARPVLSVRSPVNIIPRELLGAPILAIATPLARLPPRTADRLAEPILHLLCRCCDAPGLEQAEIGPFEQIARRRTIPLIDVGTVELIREGSIAVRPGLSSFRGNQVEFDDGSREAVDAVVLATGYRPSFDRFLSAADVDRVTEDGVPRMSGWPTAVPGLYFCGFYVSPRGMLREIGIEARRIARSIARGR